MGTADCRLVAPCAPETARYEQLVHSDFVWAKRLASFIRGSRRVLHEGGYKFLREPSSRYGGIRGFERPPKLAQRGKDGSDAR